MARRLIPLDEGSEIILDRPMVVVGRHPSCDVRLDSLRVSRHHCCCMVQENGEILVRDLGSTNGIRINSQRVDSGMLRPGDELSIAHIRYRLHDGVRFDSTVAELHARERASVSLSAIPARLHEPPTPIIDQSPIQGLAPSIEDDLTAAVRKLLPNGVADKCKIKVILEVARDQVSEPSDMVVEPVGIALKHAEEEGAECRSDSSL